MNAIFGGKTFEVVVVKFATHITLKRLDVHVKLGFNIFVKVGKFFKRLGFKFQGVNPCVLCEIIC